MVADKEIDYTVADENVAMLGSTYYNNIDVHTQVSDVQGLVWAVRKNSPRLLEALNMWLDDVRRTEDYNLVYKKYFKSKKQMALWASNGSFLKGGSLSRYDDLIKRYARHIGWDWRLLASLIYEESGFNNESCSWAGAEGLMQLMPATGYRFGATELGDPEDNIYAGTAYLNWLEKFWSNIPSEERIFFVLASYNVGEAHVQDAMRLTRKHGGDPYKWSGNVEEYLRLKSKPVYYNDTLCKSGYCRGEVTVNYVKAVLERYHHYRQHIPRGDSLLQASK
jgi:membrane-bound lytic murein transglycosylase F